MKGARSGTPHLGDVFWQIFFSTLPFLCLLIGYTGAWRHRPVYRKCAVGGVLSLVVPPGVNGGGYLFVL